LVVALCGIYRNQGEVGVVLRRIDMRRCMRVTGLFEVKETSVLESPVNITVCTKGITSTRGRTSMHLKCMLYCMITEQLLRTQYLRHMQTLTVYNPLKSNESLSPTTPLDFFCLHLLQDNSTNFTQSHNTSPQKNTDMPTNINPDNYPKLYEYRGWGSSFEVHTPAPR
jgi:hypothetical protein